jgi:nitroreductase
LINELIKNRRSIFPSSYDPSRPIDRELLEQLVENANWAPTHRLTEPWRFQVFHTPESRQELGQYLANYYKNHTPPALFAPSQYDKALESPVKAGAVIAIILQRDMDARVPEFEEIAAVAMAVQNMWLTCTEMGLGCYWSTPKAALEATEWLHLEEGQRCLGLFYIGWHNAPELPGKRGDIEKKTIWR